MKIEIYDCGCVPTRPKDPSCNTYGTRWRLYITVNSIKAKCRDCGRMHTFVLARPGVQTVQYLRGEDKNGILE